MRVGGEGTATLVLSVDKDTYEQLGIEGKYSAFKKTRRYSRTVLLREVGLSCPFTYSRALQISISTSALLTSSQARNILNGILPFPELSS